MHLETISRHLETISRLEEQVSRLTHEVSRLTPAAADAECRAERSAAEVRSRRDIGEV